MRISYCANAELLNPWLQGLQLFLRRFQGTIEAVLVSGVQFGKINGLHGRVELLLPLHVRVGTEDWLQRENLQPQQFGVGTADRGSEKDFTS